MEQSDTGTAPPQPPSTMEAGLGAEAQVAHLSISMEDNPVSVMIFGDA